MVFADALLHQGFYQLKSCTGSHRTNDDEFGSDEVGDGDLRDVQGELLEGTHVCELSSTRVGEGFVDVLEQGGGHVLLMFGKGFAHVIGLVGGFSEGKSSRISFGELFCFELHSILFLYSVKCVYVFGLLLD